MKEGNAFYASSALSDNTVPVYRFYNGRTHLYAKGEQARDAALKNHWSEEGIAFYSYLN